MRLLAAQLELEPGLVPVDRAEHRQADDAGLELGEFPAVEAWPRRVEARLGIMNDLERYPETAGPGARSAHG